MDALDYLLSNGRSTGIEELDNSSAILVKPIDYATPSSTENNSNNAWNVDFNSGGVNNNNKNNSYAVRAVAALDEEIKEGWIEAFHDCCRRKKPCANCNEYRSSDWEMDLWLLVSEVYSRTYKPKPSICFMARRPTYREIFAANFRDRIVQHWIALRIEPLFEQRFIEQGDVSHNCRKGHGTASAVNAIERDIIQVSENYTREAWVCKIDVRSFFMSIDTRIMWRLLEAFIKERYKGDDIETLLYLTKITLRNRPQRDCIMQTRENQWRNLPQHKSMFNAPDYRGLAIGNITSQLEANFYMSYYVEAIAPLVKAAGARIEQFVDDIACVSPTKEFCITFRKESERILNEVLGLTLHPDKFYCQPVKKGVKFVGTVVMPGRRYISNRTLGGFVDALRRAEKLCTELLTQGSTERRLIELRHHASSLNSYLGFAIHAKSYNIRKKLMMRECKAFWNICYARNFAVMKIRKKYDIKQFLITKEIQEYGLDLLTRRASKAHRVQSAGNGTAHSRLQPRNPLRGCRRRNRL